MSSRGRRLGIRGKLFLLSLALILVCVGVLDLYLSSRLSASITARTRDELGVRLALVARAAASLDAPVDGLVAFDRLADELGRRARARVTIITDEGRVIGDSEIELAALPQVDNHRERAEVRRAGGAALGEDVRVSPTTGRRTMYAATGVTGARGDRLIARVGLPLDEVDRAIGDARRTLLAGALLAALVAIALSSVAAELASSPARRMIEAATRMARGELTVRAARAGGDDELADLGAALELLASSLAASMEELRREHALVQSIVEGLREGVLLLDEGGQVILANASLRDLLGLPRAGEPQALTLALGSSELAGALEDARGGRVERELALGAVARRVLLRAGPHPPTGGVLAVVVDVTEVRRLEVVRREFVANASHELRTPVASILSAAETLRDAAARDPDAAPRFAALIERNALRLTRLVDDLLELSRLESRELALAPSMGDVGAAATSVVARLRERADARGVSLTVAGDARARFDARALDVVLSNLLDNALKYSPEGARVTVRITRDGDVCRVAVEDTGPGVEARHLPRLFERFYRADPGGVAGSGLGLSIVKHLAEAMDGRVSAESEPGRGATFTIELPSAERQSQSSVGGPPGGSGKI